MVPQHPRSTLFPYTTLFRSSPKSDGRRCKPGAVSGHSLRIDQLSRRLYDVVRTQGVRMGKIQDLYETRVRPMGPAERLQLAKLILNDLAPSETAIDVSDEWTDDDLADVAAYSAQYAARKNADSESNR